MCIGVLFQNCFQHLLEFRHRQLSRPCLFRIWRIYGIFLAGDTAHILANTAGNFIFLAPHGQDVFLQLALQKVIEFRPENIPKNLLPLLGPGLQQLSEIPLRDHGDLGELRPGQANDVPNGGIDLLQLGNYVPIRIDEFRRGRLFGVSGAPGFGTSVLRAALHLITFSAVVKGQLHISWGVRGGVLGAQHGGIPAVAAGFPKQGIGDGVKNGGFACAGVAGDQIEAAGAQTGKIQLLCAGVRAKAGNGQFQRPHAFSSSISSMSF